MIDCRVMPGNDTSVDYAAIDVSERCPTIRSASASCSVPAPRLRADLGEITAERPRAGHAMKRADQMPRDRMQPRSRSKFTFDVRHQRFDGVMHRRMRRGFTEQFWIDTQQLPRFLIGRASSIAPST